MHGETMGAEASYMKIFWSELDVDLHATALELLAERGELLASAPDAISEHDWMSGYLFSLSGPIYAGRMKSKEILSLRGYWDSRENETKTRRTTL